MTRDEQRAEQARRVMDHRYEGLCPDAVDGWGQRDPECPACRAIDADAVATKRLAAVIEFSDVPEGEGGMYGTVLRDVARVARGETTSHEDRRER